MKKLLWIMIVGFSFCLSSSASYALDCNGVVGFEGPMNFTGNDHSIQKVIGDYELSAAVSIGGRLKLEIKDVKNKLFKTGTITQIPEDGKEVSIYLMTENENIQITCKN